MNIEDFNIKSKGNINLSKRFRMNPIDYKAELKKLAFDLWLELGSLSKVSNRLKEMGYQNRKGNPYFIGSLRILIHDYIVHHPDDVRKVYQSKGEFPDTEEGNRQWIWYLVNIGSKHRYLRGKDNFIRWTLKQGIYKKGFHFFKTTYNLSDEDYNIFDDLIND